MSTVSTSDERSVSRPVASVACPICGHATTVAYQRMYDDRYGYPATYDVRRCDSCGHLHLGARFSAIELQRLYTGYYPRASYGLEQHRTPREPRGLRSWLRGDKCGAMYWVPKNVRVLDIGCGFCESLAYHRARGCEAHGVEADANARKVADAFGYRLHTGLFDPALYEPEYFDFVTLDQVIEHIADPVEFLAGVTRVLKPGGTVVISTPNADALGRLVFGARWIHWHIPFHLQLFTRESLRRLAGSVGLEISSVYPVTYGAWFHFQLMHLLAIPECGARHPFWSGGNLPAGKARAWARVISCARKSGVLHALSRGLDLLSVGDNQVFTLQKPLRHQA